MYGLGGLGGLGCLAWVDLLGDEFADSTAAAAELTPVVDVSTVTTRAAARESVIT